MEHNRSTKVVAIIALLVGVLGLSVGFSAYSKTLNINNVQATVQGNASNFQVLFSKSSDSTASGSVTGSGDVTGGTATIDGTTISNLTANFTKAGSVTYDFFVRNEGLMPAHLKKITYGEKSCTTTNGATQSLVTAACNDITVTVTVGGQAFTGNTTETSKVPVLNKKTGAAVSVKITNSGANAVDGDFKATIANISLEYSSQ